MTFVSQAQFGSTEQAARKNLRLKKWEKTERLLKKMLVRDSTHTAAKYLYAIFFFSADNPLFNIDSAYHYNLKASSEILLASEKERSRLGKIPLDTLILRRQREQIDSAAFVRVKDLNTEQAFITYLERFNTKTYRSEAILLRDEAAFQEALQENTYEAYYKFLQKYPQALRAKEARGRYDQLLYESRTRSGKLLDYEKFLEEYPQTPYRKDAEQHIFAIITAAGTPEVFRSFSKRYPNSYFNKFSNDILYHLLLEKEGVNPGNFIKNDSIREVEKINNTYLVPVLKNNLYGFMTSTGEQVIDHKVYNLPDEYSCGNITEDILVIDQHLTDRKGNLLAGDSVVQVDDLGFGFLNVAFKSRNVILHKSGRVIAADFDDAKLIANRFIGIKRNNAWEVLTFTGLRLGPAQWNDINDAGDVVVLRKNDNYYLVTANQLADVADQKPLPLTDYYDDVKLFKTDFLLVKRGGTQSIIDQALVTIVPFTKSKITATGYGWIVNDDQNATIYKNDGSKFLSGNSIAGEGLWIAVRQDSIQKLVNTIHYNVTAAYDSINFLGGLALGYVKDSVTVHLHDDLKIRFHHSVQLGYIIRKDSTGFITTISGKKKSIFDADGKLILQHDFESVEYGGKGFFIVSRKEKKGIISDHGKILLPVEYDAVSPVTEGRTTVLKSMKFGAYNFNQKKLIKPQFDKNVVFYNRDYFTAYDHGQYVFKNWNNKTINAERFDEVKFWNDSVALIRNAFTWKLINLYTSQEEASLISKIDFIEDSDDEKIAIMKKDQHYGVLSNKRGIIIPFSFSEIHNVGSSDQPLYFTAKHVEEAGIYVVIYYDANGQFLRREVYEEDDYGKIVCSNP